MLAKKATLDDVNLKIMVWGESGSGKSRFALSAPSPIAIDLEGSTRLYADQFDFYKAEVDKTDCRPYYRLIGLHRRRKCKEI